MSRIFFITDERHLVYPCCDDLGQEPEPEWISGEIEAPAYDEHGIPRWKFDVDQCILRTPEEMQRDIERIPIPEPTETDQLRADVDFLTMENEALESDMEQAQADIDYLLMLTEEM